MAELGRRDGRSVGPARRLPPTPGPLSHGQWRRRPTGAPTGGQPTGAQRRRAAHRRHGLETKRNGQNQTTEQNAQRAG